MDFFFFFYKSHQAFLVTCLGCFCPPQASNMGQLGQNRVTPYLIILELRQA